MDTHRVFNSGVGSNDGGAGRRARWDRSWAVGLTPEKTTAVQSPAGRLISIREGVWAKRKKVQ